MACFWKKKKDYRMKSLRKNKKKEKKAVKLQDFQFLNVIGRGAFGKVFKVKLNDSNEIFAMKVLRKDDILKYNDLQHTIKERVILYELSHHPFVTSKSTSFNITYFSILFYI